MKTFQLLIVALTVFLIAGCKVDSKPFYVIDSPDISVDGNITEFIKKFLEPAPDGYKWEYKLDWDNTIIQKCIVNATEEGGPIDEDTHTKIKSSGQPQGYSWTTEQKWSPVPGTNINIRLCLFRINCTVGKMANKQECPVIE